MITIRITVLSITIMINTIVIIITIIIVTPMVLMWSWGFISGQVVQHTMSLLKRDLAADADGTLDWASIDRLADLGTGGTHPNNIHSELVKKYKNTGMPKLDRLLVPLRHSVLGSFTRCMDMILPHELFAALYHHYPVAFRNYVCPSTDAIKSFWDSVKGGVTHAV